MDKKSFGAEMVYALLQIAIILIMMTVSVPLSNMYLGTIVPGLMFPVLCLIFYQWWKDNHNVTYFISFNVIIKNKDGEFDETNGNGMVTTSTPIKDIMHIKGIEARLREEHGAESAQITNFKRL